MTKETTLEPRKFDIKDWLDFVDSFGLEPWQGTQIMDWFQRNGWTPPETTSPSDTFEMEMENGNVYSIPTGRLLPKSTPIEVLPEEEWRNIDSILGLESFQVSDIGRIRYKHNDRVIEPSFDCLTNKHYVKLKINGKDLWIDGPVLAASMWEH